MVNGMKFNKSKCWILDLGCNYEGTSIHRESVAGDQPCRKESGDARYHQAQHEPVVCPGSQEEKLHPEVHQTGCIQLAGQKR